MEPTVYDVLTFHRPDRAAYDRLVARGARRHPARDAVALLMWLHRSACAGDDAVNRVPAMVCTRADAARFVSEVRAVLGGGTTLAEMTVSLCGVDAGRVRGLLALTPTDVIRRGVAEVITGIGVLVFDNGLHALMWRYEEGGGGGPLPPELAAAYRSGSASGVPQPLEEEDVRSLFVTFTKGHGSPLTHEEIEEYFAGMWGDYCLERVMMETTLLPGEPPSNARIVLRSAAAVEAILGGQLLVKLVINGRQLWVRKYDLGGPPQPQH